MKATLVGSVKKRFEKYNSRSCIAVATLIDPRYKAAFFTNEQIASHKAEMLRLLENVHDNQEAEKASPPRKLRKRKRVCGIAWRISLAAPVLAVTQFLVMLQNLIPIC